MAAGVDWKGGIEHEQPRFVGSRQGEAQLRAVRPLFRSAGRPLPLAQLVEKTFDGHRGNVSLPTCSRIPCFRSVIGGLGSFLGTRVLRGLSLMAVSGVLEMFSMSVEDLPD